MTKKKKAIAPLKKVATISTELALKLLASLEELANYDTYETEYDGQMMTMCHSCGWLETGKHRESCPFLEAEKLIAGAYAEEVLK